jgi:hypothetical protein
VGIWPDFDEGNFNPLFPPAIPSDPIEPIDVLAHEADAEPVLECLAGLVGITNDPIPFPFPLVLLPSTCDKPRE